MTACGLSVCVEGGFFGETKPGSSKSRQGMKRNLPARQSHQNFDSHCGDAARPLLGVMRLGDLQCKDGMMTAQSAAQLQWGSSAI